MVAQTPPNSPAQQPVDPIANQSGGVSISDVGQTVRVAGSVIGDDNNIKVEVHNTIVDAEHINAWAKEVVNKGYTGFIKWIRERLVCWAGSHL